MTDYTAQAIEALARIENGEPLTDIDAKIIGPILQSAVKSGRVPFIRRERDFLIGHAAFPKLRGLDYIRAILQSPHAPVAALDVMSAGQRHPPAEHFEPDMPEARSVPQETGILNQFDAVLDPRALREIRDRMSKLDPDCDELAAIRELLGEVTFKGQSKPFVAETEKARQAVSQAIRYAIRALVDDPETRGIGLHLKAHIKTGRLCSYGGALKWKFS